MEGGQNQGGGFKPTTKGQKKKNEPRGKGWGVTGGDHEEEGLAKRNCRPHLSPKQKKNVGGKKKRYNRREV